MATVVGKTCPYCQSPIQQHEAVMVCSACGMPHHAECWQENGRCTTFGCPGSPSGGDSVRSAPVRTAPQPAPRRTADGHLLCPTCGYAMTAFDTHCPRCANFHGQPPTVLPRAPAPSPVVPPPYQPLPPPAVIPGQYPTAYGVYLPPECPPELRRWNWGAFSITLFWTAAMNQWLYFALCFVPIVNWVIPWLVAINGNEYAWKSRPWKSIEQFQATQKVWNIWGIVLFILNIVFFIIGLLVIVNDPGQFG